MKKYLTVFLALILAVSFASCGGEIEKAEPDTSSPVSGTVQAPVSEPESTGNITLPAEAALIPGTLFQLDAENIVLRGLSLSGNRSGTEEFNSADPAAEGIRCIFELNEWVEVTPDTDADEGLGVFAFAHRDNPAEYAGAELSDEMPGFAAYCDLPLDYDAEPGEPRGSFYLNPSDCEPGYYDLVFAVNGKAKAVLLTRFYSEEELGAKTDAELAQITAGLK